MYLDEAVAKELTRVWKKQNPVTVPTPVNTTRQGFIKGRFKRIIESVKNVFTRKKTTTPPAAPKPQLRGPFKPEDARIEISGSIFFSYDKGYFENFGKTPTIKATEWPPITKAWENGEDAKVGELMQAAIQRATTTNVQFLENDVEFNILA